MTEERSEIRQAMHDVRNTVGIMKLNVRMICKKAENQQVQTLATSLEDDLRTLQSQLEMLDDSIKRDA